MEGTNASSGALVCKVGFVCCCFSGHTQTSSHFVGCIFWENAGIISKGRWIISASFTACGKLTMMRVHGLLYFRF